MTVPKYADLRKMPDDGLIAAHDRIADIIQPGISYYLDELSRRGQVRQAEEMLAYTRQIRWMTVAMTVATIVNVLIAFLRR